MVDLESANLFIIPVDGDKRVEYHLKYKDGTASGVDFGPVESFLSMDLIEQKCNESLEALPVKEIVCSLIDKNVKFQLNKEDIRFTSEDGHIQYIIRLNKVYGWIEVIKDFGNRRDIERYVSFDSFFSHLGQSLDKV